MKASEIEWHEARLAEWPWPAPLDEARPHGTTEPDRATLNNCVGLLRWECERMLACPASIWCRLAYLMRMNQLLRFSEAKGFTWWRHLRLQLTLADSPIRSLLVDVLKRKQELEYVECKMVAAIPALKAALEGDATYAEIASLRELQKAVSLANEVFADSPAAPAPAGSQAAPPARESADVANKDSALPAKHKPRKIDLALAALAQHPDWTTKDIAAHVRCHRTYLEKNIRFRAARKVQKPEAKRIARDLRTGRLDGVAEGE